MIDDASCEIIPTAEREEWRITKPKGVENLSIHHTQHFIETLPERKFKRCDDNMEVYPSIKKGMVVMTGIGRCVFSAGAERSAREEKKKG